MKKIFLFILCAMCLTSLHAQLLPTPNRDALNLSSFFGYPLTFGDVTTNDWQIFPNKLLPIDVELDPMPRFQIGAVPNQTVWHEGDITVGFYVLTDTLKASFAILNYKIDFPPAGKITFNSQTGRFKYFPDKFDARPFTVTFTAQSGSKIITQDVRFELMPATPPEYAAFGVEPIKPIPPATDDYTIVAYTTKKNVQLNNSTREVRNFSISGKELVFEDMAGRAFSSINTSPEMWDIGNNERGKNGVGSGQQQSLGKNHFQYNRC